ncbi:hypothetical protein L6164_027264 [Bauhinia variegata]|uniref:Uncharacterized protein n=1 Tax=Bauhinia variegata TaxID=167791 RepID=A0ACB9LT89_BAUVA|nr:hypothetical protein L6164_027264 [Bauhinia variegata]
MARGEDRYSYPSFGAVTSDHLNGPTRSVSLTLILYCKAFQCRVDCIVGFFHWAENQKGSQVLHSKIFAGKFSNIL